MNEAVRIGRRIRSLRMSCGFKQAVLAKRVGVTPDYISMIERGERFPGARCVARIAAELGVRASELMDDPSERVATVAGSPAHPTATYADARLDPLDLSQVEEIRRGLDDILTEGAMTEASLEDWEQLALRHGRATRHRAPGVLFAELASDLRELHQSMARGRSASSLRRLTRVAAQLSGLMCLTVIKLDDRTAFRNWARTARVAAAEAGDPLVYAWVLAEESYGHFYNGDYAIAVDVAAQAQQVVTGLPSVGSVLAAALEARAHAALQDEVRTEVALSRAEQMLGGLDADSVVPSAFGYSEAQLRFHESNAYTHLHKTEAAWKAQERALVLCPPNDYLDRTLTRLDRVSCLAHDGDVSSAMMYAANTLAPLTARQREGIITSRAVGIVERLPTHQQALPAVREVQRLLLPPARETEETLPE